MRQRTQKCQLSIGHLFGGLLSRLSYEQFGPSGTNRPDQMWIMFATIVVLTAVSPLFYNLWVTKSGSAGKPA